MSDQVGHLPGWRAAHRAVIERRARDLRLAAWYPRPDSDWDEPGKIDDDWKVYWREIARKQLRAER